VSDCYRTAFVVAFVVALGQANPATAQKFAVKIVDRQVSDTTYTYMVPGSVLTNSAATANCFGTQSVGCSASDTTATTVLPPRSGAYNVRGATFTLLLPDRRVVVVNCESKYQLKFDYVNRRSCRIPLVDEIEAEFKGSDAKLRWVVSLDGKKTESETYKILAVLLQQ
jgi:hypothetical protein